MFVGRMSNNAVRRIYRNRTQKAIEFAMMEIKKSKISSYIRHIYLYGSCARDEQTYESDVDLFIELDPSFRQVKNKTEVVLEVKERLTKIDRSLPDVEIKVVIGDQWKHENGLFYQNVKKEGKILC